MAEPDHLWITDLATFRSRVEAGRGLIVIDDPRRRTAVAHSVSCEHVREDRFVEKVLRNANGTYHWAPDLAAAERAVPRTVAACRVCGAWS